MLKIFTPLLLVLVTCTNIKAQTNPFEEGYIIQENDTIHGYIKSASDLEFSKSVEFKTDLSSSTTKTYSPTELQAFHLAKSGFHFASVKAEINLGPLSQQADRFAKQLISGYTNLYKLQIPKEEQSIVLRSQNTFLYVLKKDTTYYTLGSYETQNGDIVRTNKRYIGILRAAFIDCENFADNLDDLKFDDKSIIAEVVKYNSCKDPLRQSALVTNKIKPVVKHGLEFSFTKLYVPENKNNYSAGGFAAGYFWDIVQPDKSRKHSGKLGVAYMYSAYEYQNPNDTESSGSVHYLKLPLSGQYNFKDPLTSKLIPFINVGLTPMLSFGTDNSEFTPYFNIGAGMYHNRMRYSVQIDNDGIKFSTPKIFNFSVGLRLDK